MSSLLAYAFRRCQRPIHQEDTDFNTMSTQPGLVASLSSSDGSAATDCDVISIARPRSIVTPEGLKPRRPLQDLRAELLPPTADLVLSNNTTETGNDCLNTSTAAIAPTKREKAMVPYMKKSKETKSVVWKIDEAAVFDEENEQQEDHVNLSMSVLPPRPTESWSTAGTWSSPYPLSASQGTMSLPSQGHSWRSTPTAASPNLMPGQTRTAVGNLLASQQDPPGATPLKQVEEWLYSPQEKVVESMYSPMFSKVGSRKVLPQPHVAGRGAISGLPQLPSGSAEREKEEQPRPVKSIIRSKKTGYSDESTQSSLTMPQPSPLISSAHVLRSSSAVLNSAATKPTPHHRQVVVTEPSRDIVVSQKHLQSGSWSTTSSKGSRGRSCTNSVVLSSQNGFGTAMDHDMQRIKIRNQQRSKEELIISAFERLQDNANLVTEVEGLMGGAQDMFDWYVSTPMDEEGLLTGLKEAKRYAIMDWIDLLLGELNSGVQNEVFFLSPSKTDDLDHDEETHEDLKDALSFCKVLVEMAVPKEEKDESSLQGTTDCGRWQFISGLREAVGILKAGTETPTAADSSFFSLPTNGDVETPMASNVSFSASTLTSFPGHNASPSNMPMNAEKLRLQNGLILRQSIQMVSTGLQKLTQALLFLANGRSTWTGANLVRSASEIKKAYIQLLGIHHNDLKAMVDAFEFELDAEDSYEYNDDDDCNGSSLDGGSPVMRIATIGSGTLDDMESDRDDQGYLDDDTGPSLSHPPSVSMGDMEEMLDESYESEDGDLRTRSHEEPNLSHTSSSPISLRSLRSTDNSRPWTMGPREQLT